MNLKILFLLKQNMTSGGYSQVGKRSGLYNSANLLAEELRESFGVKTRVENVVDGNSIDKELHYYKPDVAIIEAIWVTPQKLRELVRLHRRVIFVIRVHSEIPFLSNEGVALEWIKEYGKIPRTTIALNSMDTFKSFKRVKMFKSLTYLPNVYDDVVAEKVNRRKYLTQWSSYSFRPRKLDRFPRPEINIGCFGAIRPIKNQLIQAFAAIEFANDHALKLNFHINATRLEQGGESILKNLRTLFKDTEHTLVEHPWMEREEFLNTIRQMDVGLQVSFNESFNIVAADFSSQGVPVVVSDAIKWMPLELQVSAVDPEAIAAKIEHCVVYNYLFKYMQYFNLHKYNQQALMDWKRFLF